jgi:hypothetical protein
MPQYNEEQQARLIALPTAILMAVLAMGISDPEIRLPDALEGMDFVIEVKQAYPNNVLIQGIFEDTDYSLRVLNLSTRSDKEVIWHGLRLYIEHTSELLGVDNESREFRAFLAALVKKLTEDVENGLFGDDHVIVNAQREYLRTLEIQFSPVPPNLIYNTLL